MNLFIINILLKISNDLGIDPKILFYIWKPVTYLFQHIIHLFIIAIIIFILFMVRKGKFRKLKKVLNKKLYLIVPSLTVYLIFLTISICTYEPYNNLKLKKNDMNFMVFPIFNLDKGSYLSINNDSIYFQETFFDYFKANKPEPIEITEVKNFTPVNVPVQYIPFFIYKPSTFNKFIEKNKEYEFAIWGYKLEDKFEKIIISVNPSVQINPEEDKIAFEKYSDIICAIFNELNNVPYKTRINFLSLLISGLLEQTLNTTLIDHYDSHGCDMARKKLDLCIKKINESFNDIIKIVPQNKHKIVKYYYNRYIEDFNMYRKRLDLPNSCPGFKKFYDSLLQNLYAPFKDECSYALWLSKQPYAYAAFRLVPIIHWRSYNSEFERFIDYLLNTRHLRIQMTTEHVKELFNNLRKKHGDRFIINYYEVIIFTNMWTDREHIKKLLEEQRKLNICKKDLTERQIELFNIIKDEDRFWTD